jgi:DNA-binding transcriptional LysR family regulator
VQCRLAPWFSELTATAPGLQVGFVPATVVAQPDIENLMATGQIDIAVALTTSFPDRLHARPLHYEHFVCVMRRDHPFRKEELSLAALTSMKHVFVSPLGGDFVGSVDEVLKGLGVSRHNVVSVPSFLVAEQILLKTDFISVFPATLARERISMLKAHPLPIEVPPVQLAMAWHERTHPSPMHRWLRDRITHYLNTAAADLTSPKINVQLSW